MQTDQSFLFLHQTHHAVADFSGILNTIQKILQEKEEGLHLFPELFLTGYPLQDLCLQKPFIKSYEQLLTQINKLSLSLPLNEKLALLMGGLSYEYSSSFPQKIKNVVYALVPGKKLELIYTKKLLPNYDIFDEGKYFTAGDATNNPPLWTWQGKKIGLSICEDMWGSSHYDCDPIESLRQHLPLDLVVNFSGSPFHVGKIQRRLDRASDISAHILKAPFAYINRVGAVDDLLFDGQSFLTNGHDDQHILPRFVAHQKKFPFPQPSLEKEKRQNIYADVLSKNHQSPCHAWQGVYKRRKSLALSDNDCQEIIEALIFAYQDYARQCFMNNFLVALSGGLDSAIVLALIKLGLKAEEGQTLEAIYMPSKFSATLSYDLSQDICQRLQVPLHYLPIKFLHSAGQNQYKSTFGHDLQGLADENIQSRLRGTLLYARANVLNAMVINTSNKSELAVGYSTLYGDSVGALSLLGDLYKSEIFALAKYMNRKYGNLIPEQIINRPPSAELRENQEDAQSLPPYDRLDIVLEGILSYRMSVEDLVAEGHDKEEVKKIFRLYRASEYKRQQFCPIVKLRPKSFGFGNRLPICKQSFFYLE